MTINISGDQTGPGQRFASVGHPFNDYFRSAAARGFPERAQ